MDLFGGFEYNGKSNYKTCQQFGPGESPDCCDNNMVISWWRHQMETFSALLALCEGNSPVTGEFPHKGQWSGALMCSLICIWTNDSVIIETQAIWDAIALIMTSLLWLYQPLPCGVRVVPPKLDQYHGYWCLPLPSISYHKPWVSIECNQDDSALFND